MRKSMFLVLTVVTLFSLISQVAEQKPHLLRLQHQQPQRQQPQHSTYNRSASNRSSNRRTHSRTSDAEVFGLQPGTVGLLQASSRRVQ